MATLKYQERFKTIKGVFDEFTNRNLFELQSHSQLDELVSPLFIGKESNVFSGRRKNQPVIVKIYRIQNCDFNKMYTYIKKDPRYLFLKKKKRQIILAWVQREYKNLLWAEKAGIFAPKVWAIKENVLVEEMVGDPAPPLRKAYPANPQEFLKQIIYQIKQLYRQGLIHGDLSAFNILNYNEKPYFIDFSQATLTKTPNSEELLERDIKNIISFFQKNGLILNYDEVWKEIKKL